MPWYLRVPVLKYLFAWWRVRESRLRNRRLPPVIEQFADGELIPLKGFHFRVAHRGAEGLVLAPVEFTGAMRKKLIAHIRESRHVAEQKAV